MPLPKVVREAWKAMTGPAVLTTVDKQGEPNTVYISNISLLEDDRIGIADGAFHKTRANILAGSRGNVLFLTANAAYQLKGHFEYHTEGPVVEAAKAWANYDFPIYAIVLFITDEAYHGAQRLENTP